MTKDRIKKIKTACAIALGLLLAMNILRLHASVYENTSALNVDEDAHLYNAYYYKLLFVDRDLRSPEWDNFVFYDQPPVAKYVLGFALHLVNGTLIENSAGARDWQRRALDDFWLPRIRDIRDNPLTDVEYAANANELVQKGENLSREATVTEPISTFTERDVIVGRLTVFLFALLSVAVLIAAVWYVTRSAIVSLAAGLLLVSNPLTIPVFQQVYIDSLWCFFGLASLLSLFILLKSLHDGRTKKTVVLSVVIGVCLALAIGTKIIAVYMAVVAAAALVLNAALHVRRARTEKSSDGYSVAGFSVVSLGLISIVSIVLSVALNPFLYENTAAHFLKMFEHRDTIMQIQLMTQGPAIETLSQRASAVVRLGLLSGYGTKGVLGMNLTFGYVCILLLGIWTVLTRVKGELRRGSVGPYVVIAILSVFSYAFIAATVHMEWERYFLPLLLCNVLWFSIGMDAIRRLLDKTA